MHTRLQVIRRSTYSRVGSRGAGCVALHHTQDRRAPEDELGDDVEDGLVPLRGRVLRRQEHGTNLPKSRALFSECHRPTSHESSLALITTRVGAHKQSPQKLRARHHNDSCSSYCRYQLYCCMSWRQKQHSASKSWQAWSDRHCIQTFTHVTGLDRRQRGAHPHDGDGGDGAPLAANAVAQVTDGDHTQDDTADLDVRWHLRTMPIHEHGLGRSSIARQVWTSHQQRK